MSRAAARLGGSSESREQQGMQGKLAARQELGYHFVSDGDLQLAQALGLPTVDVEGTPVHEPLTLVVRNEHIARVWFPADPLQDAATVSAWTRRADD